MDPSSDNRLRPGASADCAHVGRLPSGCGRRNGPRREFYWNICERAVNYAGLSPHHMVRNELFLPSIPSLGEESHAPRRTEKALQLASGAGSFRRVCRAGTAWSDYGGLRGHMVVLVPQAAVA
jgi:hypothetical protein